MALTSIPNLQSLVTPDILCSNISKYASVTQPTANAPKQLVIMGMITQVGNCKDFCAKIPHRCRTGNALRSKTKLW